MSTLNDGTHPIFVDTSVSFGQLGEQCKGDGTETRGLRYQDEVFPRGRYTSRFTSLCEATNAPRAGLRHGDDLATTSSIHNRDGSAYNDPRHRRSRSSGAHHGYVACAQQHLKPYMPEPITRVAEIGQVMPDTPTTMQGYCLASERWKPGARVVTPVRFDETFDDGFESVADPSMLQRTTNVGERVEPGAKRRMRYKEDGPSIRETTDDGDTALETISRQSTLVADEQSHCLESLLRRANNPRAFYKKGRVFMTLWCEPKGNSLEPFTELARFTVVKVKPRHSICLRISTYGRRATTKYDAVTVEHAAVIPVGGNYTSHAEGESMTKDPIEVKIENEAMTIDPMSRINFAKPYTVEHNVLILNVGRVVGDSIGLMDKYFAESLGLAKRPGV